LGGGDERAEVFVKLYKKYLGCNFMFKDYKRWVGVKKKINNNERYPLGFRERDIWVCNVGENVGFEEDGKGEDFVRPVLILKVFNRKFCHIVPLSTTEKRGRYCYAFDGKTGKTSVAILSQTKSVDAVRLHAKIGKVSKGDFERIKEEVKKLIF